jgi:CBS domain-containing protein
MTVSVGSIDAAATIAEAARQMGDNDVGALPVMENYHLVGIVTDRDIAVRAVGAGIKPNEPVRRVMSDNVITCSPETDLEDALEIMGREQVRRLPVCNDRKELIGIVALADAAQRDPDKREVSEALEEICEPSGLHCQAPAFA